MYVGCISRSIDFLAFHTTYSPKLKFFCDLCYLICNENIFYFLFMIMNYSI